MRAKNERWASGALYNAVKVALFASFICGILMYLFMSVFSLLLIIIIFIISQSVIITTNKDN